MINNQLGAMEMNSKLLHCQFDQTIPMKLTVISQICQLIISNPSENIFDAD